MRWSDRSAWPARRWRDRAVRPHGLPKCRNRSQPCAPPENTGAVVAASAALNPDRNGSTGRLGLLPLSLLGGSFLLPLFLVGHVMADDAAGSGAKQRMVVHEMAGNTADHSAFDATLGFCRGI